MAKGIKIDPAIELWATMRQSTRSYVRNNRQQIFPVLLFGVLVPGTFLWITLKGLVRKF